MFRKCIGINLRSQRCKFSSSTIDPSEIHHFKQFTLEWWNELGDLRALHTMNKLRVPFIRDGLLSTNENNNLTLPLQGLSILDVGCGGGILTEPLARIGAKVKGLDANAELVEVAKAHAQKEGLSSVEYVCSSIEEHAKLCPEEYNALVASEILEHVTHKEDFLNACLKCLRPGGSFFITTINKTFWADWAGIFLAEKVCQLLPDGTHQFEKFIEPHRLRNLLTDRNCKTVLVHGMMYNPLNNEWYWTSNNQINYAIHAVKMK